MPAHSPGELHRLFQEAANRADLDGLIELYEPEPAFATQDGFPRSGTESLRAHFGELLAMQPRFERVDTTKVFETGGIALTCSDWVATATGADGLEVEMTGRGAEVARRQRDGTWLLVIDNPWGTE